MNRQLTRKINGMIRELNTKAAFAQKIFNNSDLTDHERSYNLGQHQAFLAEITDLKELLGE